MTDDSPATANLRGSGSEQHARVVELCEVLRAAFVAMMPDAETPDGLSLMMTAAATYAGTIAGTLIVAGLLTDKDKRRMGEAMLHNFRAGIDVGKHRAMRIATEQFGGTA